MRSSAIAIFFHRHLSCLACFVMAPSRGIKPVGNSNGKADEAAVQQQGNSALINAKRNFSYLVSPQASTDRPARLRTRAFLRAFRFTGQFIIWRLVRWAKVGVSQFRVGLSSASQHMPRVITAKASPHPILALVLTKFQYAAVAAVVTAISATALGTVFSGVAWIAAPPTIGASIIAACVWGVGKFVARRLHKRWNATGRDQGEEEREVQSDRPLQRERTFGHELGPRAMPW